MNADWLNQLAPEHAPSPPSWWPPAPGWWLLGALCLLAIVTTIVIRQIRSGRRAKARRAAFVELDRIRGQGQSRTAAEIQHLLRRYALVVFGRERISALTGEAWLEFLAHHGGERFAGASGRALLEAAYRNRASPAHHEQWLEAAARFIRRASRRRREGA
jgi:hypothetical protein